MYWRRKTKSFFNITVQGQYSCGHFLITYRKHVKLNIMVKFGYFFPQNMCNIYTKTSLIPYGHAESKEGTWTTRGSKNRGKVIMEVFGRSLLHRIKQKHKHYPHLSCFKNIKTIKFLNINTHTPSTYYKIYSAFLVFHLFEAICSLYILWQFNPLEEFR